MKIGIGSVHCGVFKLKFVYLHPNYLYFIKGWRILKHTRHMSQTANIQLLKSWLNEITYVNIECIWVILDRPRLPIGWLKDSASSNILRIFVTLLTSQSPIGSLCFMAFGYRPLLVISVCLYWRPGLKLQKFCGVFYQLNKSKVVWVFV